MDAEERSRMYLGSSTGRRIGLRENRSPVCKPVNIAVAKPRVVQPEARREKVEKERERGGVEDKVFFPAGSRLVALTRAFLLP